MGSIYNIKAWDSSKDYVINDIVSRDSRFFYAINPNGLNNPNGPQTPVEGSPYWWGLLTLPPANETKPHFFWKPSYSVEVTHAPRIKQIQFGGGYEQRMQDGINNDLLRFNLKFENRNEQEATAIIHFLTARAGVESFIFKPPSPYSVYKKFACSDFSSSHSFVDNFSITAKLEEVA